MGRYWIVAIVAGLLLVTPAFAAPVPDALRSAGVTQADWDAVKAEVARTARRLVIF